MSKAGRLYLANHGILSGAYMTHHPRGTDPGFTAEIDDYQPPPRTQGAVDTLQHAGRVLEMVVGVSNKGQIDRLIRQPGYPGTVDNPLDVIESHLTAGAEDILYKGPGDIHGIDRTGGRDLAGKKAGEQPGACADIRNLHTGPHPGGRHDRMPMLVDLATATFENGHPLRPVRILILAVDTRPDALFVRPQWLNNEQKAAQPRPAESGTRPCRCGQDGKTIVAGGQQDPVPGAMLNAWIIRLRQ